MFTARLGRLILLLGARGEERTTLIGCILLAWFHSDNSTVTTEERGAESRGEERREESEYQSRERKSESRVREIVTTDTEE
jgi:hypothetical protein